MYLVHTPSRRGKPGRSRVLYWYRSPPGVKVGREAFDPGIRRALEAQYPDLTFDWETLAAPPPPPPAEEPWRERRRLQKARKARGAVVEVEADADLAVDDAEEPSPEPLATDVALLAEGTGRESDEAQEGSDVAVTGAGQEDGGKEPGPERRRRRRRGGRRRLSGGSPSGE